jgi:hypothetical protein
MWRTAVRVLAVAMLVYFLSLLLLLLPLLLRPAGTEFDSFG